MIPKLCCFVKTRLKCKSCARLKIHSREKRLNSKKSFQKLKNVEENVKKNKNVEKFFF